MPRWDEAPILRAKAAAQLQYEAYATSPQGVLNRDLRYLQRNRDPRLRTPTPTELAATTTEGFKQVWQRALGYGPIEVQIYGDFDRKEAVEALQRTFGALAERKPFPEDLRPALAGFPEPNDKPVTLVHRGDANQAAAVVSWPTGGGSQGIRISRELEILTQLFTNRLMDAMREKMGASYAPQVYSEWPLDLQSGGAITAMAQLDPGSLPVFFSTANEIASDLIATPPTKDELDRVTEPLRQQVARAATSSAFFMYQIKGASQDPSRLASVRTLLADYTQTSPERMQQLAAQFLRPNEAWKLAVVPEGMAGSAATPAR
jgi:zinc protease